MYYCGTGNDGHYRFFDKHEVIVLVGLSKNQLEQLPKDIIGITRTNNIEELAEIYTCADVFLIRRWKK